MRYLFLLALSLLFACGSNSTEKNNNNPGVFEWLPFDQKVFDLAAENDKLVLLDIGANWCHWCHVMDEKTYADEDVQSYLASNFILAREDQDSRPDLYAAYRNWGWPAIIVFNANKEEVLRLKGYQEKSEFLDILEKTVKNPKPIEEDTYKSSTLNASDQQLFDRYLSRLDYQKGMYNSNHKYIQLPGIEHGLKYYRQNDSLKNWVDITVENSYNLVDPVWSGVYQYSTKKDWANQHYEKLLRVQANYIQAYARYGMIARDQKAVDAAVGIFNYCERFLGNQTPLFYNSQNADVIVGQESDEYYAKSEPERLEIGTPSVDEHIYLKENAMIGASLIYLWAATNDQKFLDRAAEMATYITDNFKNHKGVYNRNEGDGANMFSFEDNRELLELFMLLYQATGDQKYLTFAENSGAGMNLEFRTEMGMVSSAQTEVGQVVVPINNLDAALNYNYLSHLTQDEALKTTFTDQAAFIYSKLDQKAMANKTSYIPAVLRAQQELQKEPFHAVYITDGSDVELGQTFYQMILSNPDQYIIFERARIGTFTEEQELLYSGTPSGTLFMCTSSFCSAPITTKIGLQEFFESN